MSNLAAYLPDYHEQSHTELLKLALLHAIYILELEKDTFLFYEDLSV